MLHVLTGRSRRLWPRVLAEIGEAYAAGHSRLFLITPDQYTLQAELELVTQLDLPGLLQIEVLSPSRLQTRVFSLAGAPQRIRVDARGKAMMLEDVVRVSKQELLYYGSAADRRGFSDKLALDIGNYKRAGRSPEDVQKEAEAFPPDEALHGKLMDIGLLYGRYEQRLAGAFIDGEDVQEALLDRLPQSGLLEGARIWIYGFDLITPQFVRQIGVMARDAVSVRLALTWESDTARDAAIFTPARDTLARLISYFYASHMQWTQEHIDAPLAAPEAVQHLEKELFAISPRQYQAQTDAIVLAIAASPYDEAMRVAAQMRHLARAGMPFDEMAVVVGDVPSYAGAVEMAFDRSDIPYHLVRNRPAVVHPLIRAWLAGLRCATQRWQVEDALDWLKGGFSGLTVEEAELLENYAIENGLKGHVKWARPIEDIELEGIRQRFVAPLEALAARLRSARTNTASLAAAYGLLEDVDAYATLEAWQNALTAKGMLAQAAECAQAWRLAMETLDQLHELLKGSRMEMAGIARVIESGLAAAELTAVPASPGMVQVGQLGHVKLGGTCRVLFLMGMQDGVMHTQPAGLLSDSEIAKAVEASGSDAAYGLYGDALAQLTQINLLDTLAAPSERLYISHSALGADGKAQRPAGFLKLIHRIFPQLVEEGSAIQAAPAWHAPGAALDAMGAALRTAVMQDRELTEAERDTAIWLLHAPDTRRQAERVLATLEMPPPPQRLGRRAADGLYALSRTSVTRLEDFANCPFKYYVSHGLRPVKRRDFEVAQNETGTFYHRAMEEYTLAVAGHPTWPELSHAENDAIMEAVLTPLRAEWENTPLGDNAMLRATGESFCRIAKRAAWTYTGQIRKGGFRTGVVEARFGPGEALPPIALVLPDGERRWIEGRIDRIDFYEEAGEQWLRVVDYKSGGTSLDPSKVMGGLQLQLLLYLAAALAAFPGMEAAGAFYSRMQDPLIETDSRDIEEIEAKLAKTLRLKGIALSDVRIVKAMGDDDMITSKGAVNKNMDATSADGLAAMMSHAYTLASSIAGQIAQGEIAPRPAQIDKWRACQYCDYRSICGFDLSVEGYGVRQIEKISKDDMLGRLGVEREE